MRLQGLLTGEPRLVRGPWSAVRGPDQNRSKLLGEKDPSQLDATTFTQLSRTCSADCGLRPADSSCPLDEREPHDESIRLGDPLGRTSRGDAKSLAQVRKTDPGRSRRHWSRTNLVLEDQRCVIDPHADVEVKVGPDGVVLQRILEELRQRNRRQRQVARVGRPDVDREADAAAVADVGQGPVPLERGELGRASCRERVCSVV